MNLSPVSSGCYGCVVFDEELIVHESTVQELAVAEVYKRLKQRFPGREIGEHEVQFNEIKSTLFDDGSLGCGANPDQIFTQGQISGYITEFSYDNQIYHLHTEDGEYFVSDDLKIQGEYGENILGIVMKKLNEQTGREIDLKDVVVDAFEKKWNCKKISFQEWQKQKQEFQSIEEKNASFDAYMNQEKETHYLFKIAFEGDCYTFCFTETGETRSHNWL